MNLCESSSSSNLEYWMTELPPQLKNEPIIYLAIPGSHNSMSYGINRSSTVGPDAPPVLRRLFPLFRGSMIRWSKTQAVDVTEQLNMGIRYFDLRIATKPGSDQFFFTHGLYADQITTPLTQIKEFLDSHLQEIVILDFQHFYDFVTSDHHKLVATLVNMFGPRLCPRQANLEGVTLNSLHRQYQQIIIVYRHQAAHLTGRFWQSPMMPNPWPQQEYPMGLLNFLARVKREPGVGFVHQAVLTPSAAFILIRLPSNLRDKCAIPVQDQVLPKLSDFSPGIPRPYIPTEVAPLNVVIADFVEMDDYMFSQVIIGLNFKLLKS